MTEILWRWREHLVPKTFTGLYMGLPRAEAEEAARKAGEYSASRVYEVSLDGGATWHSAPAYMPVIDIEGNPITDERRRTGKPSDAARREIDRRLRAAAQ